jgi:tetratricopeptide (TPR) repeat protein
MHTVSFFSFKGGVGRTNLMLNVAYGLAQRGDFVVLADWDLHAPGFSLNPLFYRPGREQPDTPDIRQGVLDFLDSALDPEHPDTILDPASLAQPTVLGTQDRQAGRLRKHSDIWAIPAGRFSSADEMGGYHEQLQRVQGRNLAQWLLRFKHRAEGESIPDPHQLLDYFRERVASIQHPETKRTPDWLLIDSRTGITEIGDLLLHTDFIDRMVLVSGFNEQNLAGIEAVIRSVQAKSEYGTLQALLSLVFSPVPQGEEQLKQARLEHIRAVLDSLARQDEYGAAEPLPNLLTISYHPRIALREEIMLREFPHGDMISAYRRVLDDLCGKTELLLEQQKAQTQAALQDADILPTQPKGSQPQIPATAFARLPAWNWPNPSLTSEQFKPSLPRAALPMLNNLASSLALDKQQKQRILVVWLRLSQSQQFQVQKIFSKEKQQAIQFGKENFAELFALHTQRFTEWLAYWIEQGLVERDAVLARLLAGEMDNVLGTWPKVGFFWYQLAHYLKDIRCWEYAETAYRRALACDPGYAPTWNDLGNLLIEHLGRYEEAEQAYREAIARDAQFAYPWNGLGNLLKSHLGRYEEAEQAYREAIARDAQYALPWNGLGTLLLLHFGRYEEAEQAYREAIARDAQDALPWNGLGKLLYRCQRYAEAAEAFRRAIDLGRDDKTPVYLCLAELGLVADQLDWVADGLAGARQSVKTERDRLVLALLTLGQALLAQDWVAVQAAHQALLAQQFAVASVEVEWIFADQVPFVARLPELAQALYQAWVAVLDPKAESQTDPAAAFAAWAQAG